MPLSIDEADKIVAKLDKLYSSHSPKSEVSLDSPSSAISRAEGKVAKLALLQNLAGKIVKEYDSGIKSEHVAGLKLSI